MHELVMGSFKTWVPQAKHFMGKYEAKLEFHTWWPSMGKVFDHNKSELFINFIINKILMSTYFFFYFERKLRKLEEVSAWKGAVLVENIQSPVLQIFLQN